LCAQETMNDLNSNQEEIRLNPQKEKTQTANPGFLDYPPNTTKRSDVPPLYADGSFCAITKRDLHMSKIPYFFKTPVPSYFYESGWFDNENTFKFVTWAFSKCQSVPHTVVMDGREITLAPFEFIAGRLSSPKECFMTEEMFRHQLNTQLKCGFLKKGPNSTPNRFTCYIWVTERFSKPNPQLNPQLTPNSPPTEPPQNKSIDNKKEENKKEKIKKEKIEQVAKPDKTLFREFVSLTQVEHEKLLAKYGQPLLDWALDFLDAYKANSEKKYKSDFAVINAGWLAVKIEKENPLQKSPQQISPTHSYSKYIEENKKLSLKAQEELFSKDYQIELSSEQITLVPIIGQGLPWSLKLKESGFKEQLENELRKRKFLKKS